MQGRTILENGKVIMQVLDALSSLVRCVPFAPKVTLEWDTAPGDLLLLLSQQAGGILREIGPDAEYEAELAFGPLLVRARRRNSTTPAPAAPWILKLVR